METKSSRRGKVITTTYTCPSCSHTYKDKLDLNREEEPEDSAYEEGEDAEHSPDLEEVIDLDLHPLVYTVNDPIEARKFQSWGVESLFSDEPDVIAENLLTVH